MNEATTTLTRAEVHRRVDAHPFAVPSDTRHADGRDEVRLACARTVHQHDVMRGFGERHFGQGMDELAIHRRAFEVEAGRSRVHRNFAGCI